MAGALIGTCRALFSRGVHLHVPSFVSLDSRLEAPVSLGRGTYLSNCTLGRGTYISGRCRLERVRFGRYCSIGQQLHVAVGRHPTRMATTHPAFYSRSKQSGFTFADSQILDEQPATKSGWWLDVGHDVWIGDRVTVLGGVAIGTGCIIGAGAVVTRNLAPYGIYAGSPAREVGRRCTPQEAEQLIELEWWSRDEAWLRQNWQCFRSVTDLLAVLVDTRTG